MTKAPHVHIWRETEVYCEDCGDHPAVTCDADGCPLEDQLPIDIIYNDDPRDDDA